MKRSGERTTTRTFRGGMLTAVVLAALVAGALPAGAAAEVTVVEAYNELPPLIKPAPLVTMNFPAALHPIGKVRVLPTLESHGRYVLLYSKVTPAKNPGGRPVLAADLEIRDLGAIPLRKEERKVKRYYHESATVVRGRPGMLAKGRHAAETILVWSENGALYELGTGTPKVILLAELQAVASGLERVVGQLQGSTPTETGFSAKDLDLQARVLLGEHTALIEAGWTAACTYPLGSENSPTGVGKAIVTLPLGAGSVSLPATPVPTEESIQGETAAWTVSVSATLSSAGGQLAEQVSGTQNGFPCAFGPATFPLVPFHEL